MTNFSQKTIFDLENKFIFEPLNIEFDENLIPKEKNEDYFLLKEIFMNQITMKTSTIFACGTPKNDTDLHLAMISCVEQDDKYKEEYGIRKLFYKKEKKYVGIGGFVRRKEYGFEKFFVEGMIFLKSEYIGSGLGFWLEKIYFAKLDHLNAILIASAWEENKTAIKLMQKNGMTQKGSFNKIYDNKIIKVGMFIKFPNNIIIPDHLLNIEEFFICNKITENLEYKKVQNI